MNLLENFQAGGFFMYFILLFAVLTIGFVIERTYALFISHKIGPQDLRKNLLGSISKGDFSSASDFVQKNAKDTAVGRIVMTGIDLRWKGAGEEELQARMDESLSKEISHVDKRTGFLAMFGNVATLFGLLGTVTGLISSFAGVASATPMERATLLGQGIAEALNSTAFGLIAAIPALVAFAVFQNKTDKIINEMTEQSSQIYHDLLFYSDNQTQAGEDIPSPLRASIEQKAENTLQV